MGEVVPAYGVTLELRDEVDVVATVAGRHGFTEVSHTLEVFGTCPACA